MSLRNRLSYLGNQITSAISGPREPSPQSNTAPSLISLPPELMNKIAELLTPLSRHSLRMTCRTCREALASYTNDPHDLLLVYDQRKALTAQADAVIQEDSYIGAIAAYAEKLGNRDGKAQAELGHILSVDLSANNLSGWTVVDTSYAFSALQRLVLRVHPIDLHSTFALPFFRDVFFPALTCFVLVDETSRTHESRKLDEDEYKAISNFFEKHSSTLVVLKLPLQWGVLANVPVVPFQPTNLHLQCLQGHQDLLIRWTRETGISYSGLRELSLCGRTFIRRNVPCLPQTQGICVLRITVEDRGVIDYDDVNETYPQVESLHITARRSAEYFQGSRGVIRSSEKRKFVEKMKRLKLFSLLVTDDKTTSAGSLTRVYITRNAAGSVAKMDEFESRVTPYLRAVHDGPLYD